MKFIITIFIISISWCFAQKKEVSIHVKTLNAKVKEISVFTAEFQGNKVLSRAKLDSNGNTILTFEISKPYFVFINLGESNQETYIKPGEKYEVSVDYNRKFLDLVFKGKNAPINNQLEQAKRDLREFKYNNKEYYQWSSEEFLIGIEKIDSILNTKRDLFFEKTDISSEEKVIIEDHIKVEILMLKMNQYMAKYNPFSFKSAIVPMSLLNIEKYVPFNLTLFEANSESYQIVLRYYYEITSLNKIKAFSTGDISLDSFLKFTYKDINTYSIPIEYKEFMLAKLLISSLNKKVIESFDEFFNQYKSNFPNSQYSVFIDKRVFALASIKNGNQAAEILGKNTKDKSIKLSDFLGKYVFVDFWATWCGPCIKELPHSLKIENKFKTNKDVVFLYVSVDQDREKWKNYLAKHPEFSENHIKIDEDKMTESKQAYALYVVPRYVIIGKDGKIINANVEPPSSGNVEERLLELLKQ